MEWILVGFDPVWGIDAAYGIVKAESERAARLLGYQKFGLLLRAEPF